MALIFMALIFMALIFMVPIFMALIFPQLSVTHSLSGPNKLRPPTPQAFLVCVKDKILHS